MLRFAPSPTGDMHIGNLRAAIFNYLIAKQSKQKFLLRIEDTDLERNIKDKDKAIMSLLSLFGIEWDELFYQSQNFARHQQLAAKLIEENKAFYCYCTKEFLDQKRQEAKQNKQAFRYDPSWATLHKQTNQNPVIRIKSPNQPLCFDDQIKGKITFNPQEIDSFVIIKENQIPTYNFACAIDDMLFDISMIIRGEDHVSNTPKQLLIHQALGYSLPISFAHLPILLNNEGKKMSKRDNASSVQWLLDEGFLPQAIANYLISIGNQTPSEVFSLHEAISWFDLKKVAKAPARFDLDKLKFLNREHLKRLSQQELAFILGYKDEAIGELARLYLQESSTLNQLRDKIDRIFMHKGLLLERQNHPLKSEIIHLQSILQKLIIEQSFDSFQAFSKQASTKSNLKGKQFFKPLRFLLTGDEHGPELSELFLILRPYLQDILRS